MTDVRVGSRGSQLGEVTTKDIINKGELSVQMSVSPCLLHRDCEGFSHVFFLVQRGGPDKWRFPLGM